MSDSTRVHTRVEKQDTPGQRYALSVGSLLMPVAHVSGAVPLVVHFHGAPWLAEWSVRQACKRCAALAVQIGAGSGVYSKGFAEPGRFAALIKEAEAAAHVEFRALYLTSFSAGYGAIREVLKHEDLSHVQGILLMDSLHSGYASGTVEPEPLEPFVAFARNAAAGRKQMLMTHSEVFPGTFASTTETADFVLAQIAMKRVPVLRWGPLGMQQLSRAQSGRFELRGFAGNSAPDHVDHLHAMRQWLRYFRIH